MSYTHNIFILLFYACAWVCSAHAVEIRNDIIYLSSWFGDCNWSVLLEKSDTNIRHTPKGKVSYAKGKIYVLTFFHRLGKKVIMGLDGKNVASFGCKQSAVLACTNEVF